MMTCLVGRNWRCRSVISCHPILSNLDDLGADPFTSVNQHVSGSLDEMFGDRAEKSLVKDSNAGEGSCSGKNQPVHQLRGELVKQERPS